MNKTNTKSTGSLRGLAMTLLMGSASAGLYFLLSLYSDTLQELAAATRQGDKLYALVPVVIALTFSFVHGTFTSRFFDLLGLRAKK